MASCVSSFNCVPCPISFELIEESCASFADDGEMSNVPTVSNVRQDLSEFQAKHAKIVLSSVKVRGHTTYIPNNQFPVDATRGYIGDI